MRMPSSVTCVSPVSSKLRLAPVSHTLNIGDLVLRNQHLYLLQHCTERLWGSFHYYALGPLSKNVRDMLKLQTCLMSKLTSQCAQYCFADSSEVCSGIIFLGLVLSLVFTQERKVNRSQHLIYVQLTDQVSLYKHLICRPRF